MSNVKFTVLDNYKDTDTKSALLPLRKFSREFKHPIIARKDEAPAYVMAVFGGKVNGKGNLRHANNVISYSGIVLDIDNSGTDYTCFFDAKEGLNKSFSNYSYIIHSTISSTVKKIGLGLLFPSYPI